MRNGNGDEASGDGWCFHGRGLLRITGRSSYRTTGAGLGQLLERKLELLEQSGFAAPSAAWWWASRGLNDLTDRGEFAVIIRRINDSTNGQVERLTLWERATGVLT